MAERGRQLDPQIQEQICRLRRRDQTPILKIAARLEVDRDTVRKYLRKNGIEVSPIRRGYSEITT